MRWHIFAAIFTIQLLITAPSFLDTCRSNDFFTRALYVTHHAADVFLFWAPLFLTRRIEWIAYIAFAAIVATHWFSYGNRCILTVVMNRACGYPEDDWLDSLKNRFGLRMVLGDNFHFLWVGLIVAWGIWKMAQS